MRFFHASFYYTEFVLIYKKIHKGQDIMEKTPITPRNTASLWLEEHTDIDFNWEEDYTNWYIGWQYKNEEYDAYLRDSVNREKLRQQIINNISNSTKKSIEKEYEKKADKKKGWLDSFRATEEYEQQLTSLLESNKEYKLLNSDNYADSKQYQEKYNKCYTAKRNWFLSVSKDFVKTVMIERAWKECLEHIDAPELSAMIDKMDLQHKVLQRIEKHLKNSKIRCKIPPEAYYEFASEGMLNATERTLYLTIKYYRKYLFSDGLPRFMNNFNTFSGYVFYRLQSKQPWIEQYSNFSKNMGARIKDAINTKFALDDSLAQLLNETVTDKWITDCVLENPKYEHELKALLRRQEYENFIKNGILERIPDKYEDLYPLARTINRHFILHIGPTNSGKTYEAMTAFRNAKNGIYLAPLRLLAYEAYEESNNQSCACNMHTGEEDIIVSGATHTSCTIELANFSKRYDLCVIDEAQMLSDPARGGAWTAAIVGIAADVVHICAAPSAKNILIQLIEFCNDTYEVIEHERSVPLIEDKENFKFPDNVKPADALIVFSKQSVLKVAAELQKKGWKVSVIYGALPYESRRNEVDRFIKKETDVIVATDAIGMGMNLPIKRIVFLENEKFDGYNRRKLLEQEVKQIAGRAGRQGIYDVGYYTSEFSKGFIHKKVTEEPLPIKNVYVNFPEILLSIESNLSDILKQWMQMPDNGFYHKQDLSILYKLTVELERISDDKGLIYQFVTIPFDEENTLLRNLWKKLFTITNDMKGSVSYYDLPEILGDYNEDLLEDLELEYKKSDLLYNYLRKFDIQEGKEFVLSHKKEIADKISLALAMQKLPIHRCKRCGKQLPWNYPHRICSACYEKQYFYYYK